MSDAPAPLESLVRDLVAQAQRPPERALALAPELYVRPDVYALEEERIFRRDWMCIARVDQLARAGDFLKVDLAGEPLVLVRDAQGTLRALSRVCRHRGMDLLHGAESRRGSAERFECPYHLWSYGLDGRLQGAPEMRGALAFDRKNCRLPEFPLEIWQGFVFVNLDRGAAPLAPRLRELEPFLGGVDLRDWRVAATLAWGHVDVNWKIAVENFAECYHHMGTHRDTLQRLWPATTVTMDETSSRDFIVGRLPIHPSLAQGEDGGFPIHPIFLPPIPGLSPRQRSETLVVGIFPIFSFALAPDAVSWFEFTPTGATSHHLDIHIIAPPASFAAPGFAEGVKRMSDALHAIQTEDAFTNAGVQAGVRARAAVAGPLSPLERTLWQFQRYLAHQLTGAEV